jgi:hypothetical protein
LYTTMRGSVNAEEGKSESGRKKFLGEPPGEPGASATGVASEIR